MISINAPADYHPTASYKYEEKKSSYKNLNGISIFLARYNELETIERLYFLINEDEIKLFLLENKFLIDFLKKTVSEVKGVFGDFPIFLELKTDEEMPDWKTLFVKIKTSLNREDAKKRENWLLEKLFFRQERTIKRLVVFSEDCL